MSDPLRPPEPNPYPGPYKERFPIGCPVEVADEETLNHFKATWKYHHPLDAGQLHFAGLITTVSSIGYYHGGDVLYQLRDTPSYTWHDACLRIPGKTDSAMDEMDRCPYLDLVNISEHNNSLRLIVAELSVSDRIMPSPPSPVEGAHPVEHTRRDHLFEVFWPRYVAYNVFNESYAAWDPSQEFQGKRFREYQTSRYLDFVRTEQNVGFSAPMYKHWGIMCENHIIDVVSEVEPNVARYGKGN
ncbi:MAG: hypothetical protein WAJ94_13240 [Candidatus Cybelea sp.]